MDSKILSINFGTDGYRGIIGDNFTFDVVGRISVSLAEYLSGDSKKTVAIGYDTRFLSEEFAMCAAAALMTSGIKVILSRGFCPSPVLSYYVRNNKCSAGIMITASHNPFMFNGLKFKSNLGSSMLEGDVKKIEKIVNARKNNKEGAKSRYVTAVSISEIAENKPDIFHRADFKKDYLNHVMKLSGIDEAVADADKKFLKSLRVVIDPMFGAGISYLSEIFSRLGIRWTSVNDAVNPSFPGLNPEPIDINLSRLKTSVKKIGSENFNAVGFATDGDADRIGAVDSMGIFIDSHKIFSVILDYLAKKGERGSVVKTVSVSRAVDRICENYGLKLHEVPIGFKNIAEVMLGKGSDVFIGGEESGGIGIASHLPERDGVFNALMLLKIMIEKQKNLAELVDGIFDGGYPYCYKREDIHIAQSKKDALINSLKKGTFDVPYRKNISSKNFMDGFKYNYADDSWLLIRPSGTEPVLRIYCETNDKARTNMLIKKVRQSIEKLK